MPRMNAAERMPLPSPDEGEEMELKAEDLKPISEAKAAKMERTKARKTAKKASGAVALRDSDLVEISEAEAGRIETVPLHPNDLEEIGEKEASGIEAAKTARKKKKTPPAASPNAPRIEKLAEGDLEEIEEGDAEWIEVAKAAKKKKTPPATPPDAPRIEKLADEDLVESWEGEAQQIEAVKIDREMAAQAADERRKWREAEEARRTVDQLSLEAEREKLQQEELRAAERQAISDLHTERINRQLDAQEDGERSAFEGPKPKAQIATRWERAIGWLKKKLG